MNLKHHLLPILLAALSLSAFGQAVTPTTHRWSEEKANAWYEKLPWLAGCNFIPSDAINQLEMWQADTWNPALVEQELQLAADTGFNLMRVYLHDLAYQQDPEGFLRRMEHYLAISAKHRIYTMFVFFDDCWLDDPRPGTQPEPLPGVHNSGWLESPGRKLLDTYPENPELRRRLETYVKAVLTRFKNDRRVLVWDLYNEPGNGPNYREDVHGAGMHGRKNGQNPYGPLLEDVYIWAREINPSQPVTTCVWAGNHGRNAAENWADVIAFHNYKPAGNLRNEINYLKKFNRPIFCTEYMARPKSDFRSCMPILAENKIAAINWGFVAGKTNTIYSWGTWKKPGKLPEPDVWFHDIYRRDGTPFRQEEIDVIKRLTTRHNTRKR